MMGFEIFFEFGVILAPIMNVFAGSQKKYNRITISFVHMQFLAGRQEHDDRRDGGEGVGDRNGPPDTVYRCVKEGRKP